MDPEANMATARRFFEAANNDDFEAFNDVMIEDFITHGDALFPFVRGRDILKTALPAFKAAFPDAKINPVLMFADGDKVVAHAEVTGTHTGTWLGVEATGKKMKWTASTVIRFGNDGKMVERWVIEDELGVMEDLGVAPPIGFAARQGPQQTEAVGGGVRG
jgi:steroid delta-isomerase-like uncharacterized protein